jgi:hypothetical protein
MIRKPPAPTIVLLAALAFLVAHALAQTPAGGRAPSLPPAQVSKPAWKDLTATQKDALAPLAKDWDTFDRSRKLKWLEVADKYPQLSPEGQKRLQERMVEFVKLTPEQRRTARSNFQRAYELPMEQRQSLVQQYQELPPEKKRALADKAGKKPEPPRRRAPMSDPKAEQKSGTPKAQ